MSGASLLMPGPFMTAEGICAFVRAERPTLAATVPTIWQAILQYGQATDIDLSSLRMGTSGGATAPRGSDCAHSRGGSGLPAFPAPPPRSSQKFYTLC
jgi:acyl-coenzyme A synthetase/AMP-(fatty) acid ligase